MVNLDPFQTHETLIHFLLADYGLQDDDEYQATDLITGDTYLWHGGTQYVRLDPMAESAHIFELKKWQSIDYADPCS